MRGYRDKSARTHSSLTLHLDYFVEFGLVPLAAENRVMNSVANQLLILPWTSDEIRDCVRAVVSRMML